MLAAMVLASPAGAEYYRYVDRYGNTVYTDDLSKVPADQRAKAKLYDDSSQAPAPEPPKPQAKTDAQKNEIDGDTAVDRKRLETLKTQLDEEFKSLEKENTQLRMDQKEAKTAKQIKAFNTRADSFNKRFEAYKEKEAVYKTRLEAYNNKVKAVSANPEN